MVTVSVQALSAMVLFFKNFLDGPRLKLFARANARFSLALILSRNLH